MIRLEIANPIVPVEINFINNYLPKANPTHVMVYIYALGLCYANKPCDNASIAEALDILESDVIKAWKYWVKTGLISLGENGKVTFLSSAVGTEEPAPEQKPQAKAPAPKAEATQPKHRDIPLREVTMKMETDADFSNTVKLAQIIWSKPLTQNEIKDIYSFREWYHFSNEIILMMFEYCAIEEKTKNTRYMESVAEAWYNENITTVKVAEKVIKRREKEITMVEKCRQIFGLNRAFSDKEIQYISDWTNNLSMSEAMIKEAYARTTLNTGKLSFPYMNKILIGWSNEGIKTIAAIKESEGARKPKSDKASSSNYDFDDIERLELSRRFNKKNDSEND